ncbi:RDD family protein [Cohnella sp. AR92]|uniref:RDD family protein n=1 Tax=Cohnella sp. AR92 TaxID=648716 RepID=UPI00131530C0|nr:RDD family protein [Cohnella sp. AR92]
MTNKPTPWRRFWARYFDFYLHAIVLGGMWAVIDYESINKVDKYLLGFLIMVVYFIADGTYMAYFGTTLGKKLMKINVMNQGGSKIARVDAYKRSRLVWLRGMGLGIGIIELIANIIGYSNLKRDGVTSWDRDLELRVTYGKISWPRYLVCPAILICVSVLIIYGMIAGDSL